MKKSIFSALFFVAVIMFSVSLNSQITKAQTISIYGYQDYDEAYRALQLTNEARAKVGLSALTMDLSLLNTANQRSAEVKFNYDKNHNRPDGTSCHTAFTTSGYWGENIAIGYDSAEEVVSAWIESAGHYQTMTKSHFTRVGIACFKDLDGRCAWVQCFGSGTPTGVSYSGVQSRWVSISTQDSLIAGQADDDETINANETIENHFYLKNTSWMYYPTRMPEEAVNYSLSDNSIATIDAQGVLTPKKAGTVTVYMSAKNFSGASASRTITIQALDLYYGGNVVNNNTESITYDGKEHSMDLAVTYKGNTLVENVDYTVSYDNKKNAGYMEATITGINKFTGSLFQWQYISPRNIRELQGTIYITKAGEVQKVEIMDENTGLFLTEGTEFTCTEKITTTDTEKYLKVVLQGIGNYTGSVEQKYTIETYDTSEKEEEKTEEKKETAAGQSNQSNIPNTDSTNNSFQIQVKRPAKILLRDIKVKKRQCKVRWYADSEAKKYQIQLARNRAFTKGKRNYYVGKNTQKKVIKNLKRKKVYYIRVRAYTYKNGRKLYGKWSYKLKFQTK